MNYLMKCGCVAVGIDANGKPVCPIHILTSLHREALEIDTNIPTLTGRIAKCCYGNGQNNCHPDGRPEESSLDLAFFKYQPQNQEDSYYCGCWGWD